jgi:D-alanyl-D-alanine carboxypeptidase (penicillin-binding protein 5/6)
LRHYNKFFRILLALTLICSFGLPFREVKAVTEPPETISESIVILDVDSGELIYNKNGSSRHMIASTSKVMTALLAYENLKMDQMVTVGSNPPYAEGSSMGFKENEEIMVIDLLYSLILHSANDAAEILAEAVDGSIEKFAERMTSRAKDIGTKNTVFHNPSGLSDSQNLENNNYTTAMDLALITAEVLKYDELIELSQKKSHMLPLTNLVTDNNRWATNKNQMLYPNSKFYYEPIVFGKTGWTPEAGFSWTAIAEKDGRRLVVSMLNAANQDTYWKETKSLLEWAYGETKVNKLYSKGQLLESAILSNGETVPLYAKDDFYYVTGINEHPMPVIDFSDMEISQNYKAGETVHVAEILLENKVIGEIELVCEDNIHLIASEGEESSDGGQEDSKGSLISQPIFEILGTVFLGVAFIFILLFILGQVMKKRRRQVRSKRMSTKRMQYLKQLEESRKL